MWVLIVFAILFVFSYIAEKFTSWMEWINHLRYTSAVVFCICVVVYVFSFPTSVSNNGSLRAYAADVHEAYVETARLTQEMVVAGGTRDQNSSMVVDAAYWEQAKAASERWAELRDALNWYNSTLRKKREYYSNWFLKTWIAEPPPELDYIPFER